MKLKVLILLVGFVFSGCTLQKVESQSVTDHPKSEIRNPKSKPMVLVELFTSEGCSSCPPADRALAFLQKEQPVSNAEVITLAFHVDYWDNLGWKDEFSTPLFTQRQQFYAGSFKLSSSYTPQMIVDGQFELVGSNLGKANKAIMEAAKTNKPEILLTGEDERLKVNISSLDRHENSTVYLAIAENNLSSDVARGENAGNKLEHISVVRELKLLGNLNPETQTFETEYALELQPNWKKENLKFVVFIQENQSRKILGSNFWNYLNKKD
jgi:hypothetical protein